MARRSHAVRFAVLFGGALVCAALALPRHDDQASAAPAGGAQVVRVVERDFRITVTPRRIASGSVVFRIANRGPDAHELLVVRDSGPLPLRADGLTVDEDALARRIVTVLEPAPPGTVREARVRLEPGRYLLICNMYGHLMGGMQARVVAG